MRVMRSKDGHPTMVLMALAVMSIAFLSIVVYASEDVSAGGGEIRDIYEPISPGGNSAVLVGVMGSGVFNMPETVVIDGEQYTVTSIGANAFRDSSITTVILSSTVVNVRSDSFDDCPTLSKINVASGGVLKSYNGVLFDSDYSTLIRCPEGKMGTYYIPSGVITVSDRAFFNCKGITKIEDSGGISSIGNYAFANSGLKSASMPLGILTIGDYAFYACHDMSKVFIPWSVLQIGEGVFSYCASLDSIEVQPSNINYTSIDGVLYTKSGGEIISVPGKYEGAFVIPDSVTVVHDGAFTGCHRLESITIGKSISYLNPYIFEGCDSLRYFEVDPENTVYQSMDGVILMNGGRELVLIPSAMGGTLDVPEGVVHIEESIFLYGSKLTGISLPSTYSDMVMNFFEFAYGLQSIDVDPGNPYFESNDGCLYDRGGTLLIVPPSKSGEVRIKDGTAYIDVSAFDNCVHIESILLPSSIRDMDAIMLLGCDSLQRIEVHSDNPELTSLDGVLFDKSMKRLIYYPGGRGGTYAVPEGVVVIRTMAFAFAPISSVYIPSSVVSIENMAFYGCSSLRYIEIAGNPELGSGSFNLGTYSGKPVECVVVCNENPEIMSSQSGITVKASEPDYGNRARYAPAIAIVCICLVEASLIISIYKRR